MWQISAPLIISTFGIIFLAELPDKTALATLALAAKFKPRDVIIGACSAFLIQSVVAVAAGSFLTLLPERPIHIASGLGFLAFAVLAWRRNQDHPSAQSEDGQARTFGRHTGWVASFLVVFAAEWGDLTQLATAALVAQNGRPLSIGIGATAALWTVTIIAASFGARLGKLIAPRVLNAMSAVLFAGIGMLIIATALAAS